MYGSEVVVDVSKKQLERMEAVQVSFFRRLKRRGRKTPKGPLWSETGVNRVRYRRLKKALGQARYEIMQHNEHYAKRRLKDSIALYERFGHRAKTWVGDVEKALANLPKYPVAFDISNLESVEGIHALIEAVDKSCTRRLYDEIATGRFPLFINPARKMDPKKLQSVFRLRKYMRTVVIPAHRQALTRLLCADHPFAIEQMRRTRRADGSIISRDCRPCRYCNAQTESEVHVLFACQGLDDLVARRDSLLTQVGPSRME